MNVPFDHLSAIVAGAVVLLMLISVDRRGQTDSIRAVEYHALSAQTTSFGEDIRRDLEALSEPISMDTTGGTFSFRARLTPYDTTQQVVTYTRTFAEVRDGIPLYRIQRAVDGTSTGGSPGLMQVWNLQAQTADGTTAADPAEVVQMRAEFEMVAARRIQTSETTGENTIPNQKRWEATIVPMTLHFRSL